MNPRSIIPAEHATNVRYTYDAWAWSCTCGESGQFDGRDFKNQDRAGAAAGSHRRAVADWHNQHPITVRYITLGGGHVVVAEDGQGNVYRVECEGCDMPLDPLDATNDYDVVAAAEEHAAACRRVPKRLWPQMGGAQ